MVMLDRPSYVHQTITEWITSKIKKTIILLGGIHLGIMADLVVS